MGGQRAVFLHTDTYGKDHRRSDGGLVTLAGVDGSRTHQGRFCTAPHTVLKTGEPTGTQPPPYILRIPGLCAFVKSWIRKPFQAILCDPSNWQHQMVEEGEQGEQWEGPYPYVSVLCTVKQLIRRRQKSDWRSKRPPDHGRVHCRVNAESNSILSTFHHLEAKEKSISDARPVTSPPEKPFAHLHCQ